MNRFITVPRKIINSVQYAWKGIRAAYAHDTSFRLEVNWGLPICAVLVWIFWPLAFIEAIALVGSYLWILRTELLNTGIEFALNHLHPGRHERIGVAKDTVSAGVLMEFIFAVTVVFLITIDRWIG